jgi:glycosyltransferase involved in cell wall biosynthesis
MISLIIPFHNEEGNLTRLYLEIKKALVGKKYEIVFINDGSTDNSLAEVKKIKSSEIVLINFRRRFGKGKALKAGFEASKGEIVVFMDADLQDNPSDLDKFINKVKDGFDLVNGYRQVRNDGKKKTWPSKIFNNMLRLVFKSKFHDINCGFKAMRREILEEIPLYGDNYRFLPLLAEKEGYRTSEVVVDHRSRTIGQSKYGFIRLFFGLVDTLTTYFIYKFSEKPLHFFGPIGAIVILIGTIMASELVYRRFAYHELLYRRPAFTISIFLITIGIQIILTGVVAELTVYLRQKADKQKLNHLDNVRV